MLHKALKRNENVRSLFCHRKDCSYSALPEKTESSVPTGCAFFRRPLFVLALYFSTVLSKHFFFKKKRKEVQSNKLSHTNVEQWKRLFRQLKLMCFFWCASYKHMYMFHGGGYFFKKKTTHEIYITM